MDWWYEDDPAGGVMKSWAWALARCLYRFRHADFQSPAVRTQRGRGLVITGRGWPGNLRLDEPRRAWMLNSEGRGGLSLYYWLPLPKGEGWG